MSSDIEFKAALDEEFESRLNKEFKAIEEDYKYRYDWEKKYGIVEDEPLDPIDISDYNIAKRFDGDIIITDPCYLVKEDTGVELPEPKKEDFFTKGFYYTVGNKKIWTADPELYPDVREKRLEDYKFKWRYGTIELKKNRELNKKVLFSPTLDAEERAYNEACSERQRASDGDRVFFWDHELSKLGFTNYLMESTCYGDWSCTVFNSDTHEKIGEFCADGGDVGVFLLDEVLKYNPNYDDHIKCPHVVTLIKDFHGTIEIHKETIKSGFPSSEEERDVTVIGKGNINFKSIQTGL